MERRALIAIALSFLIFVTWGYFFAPPKQPPQTVAPAELVTPLAEQDVEAVAPRERPDRPDLQLDDSAAVTAELEETIEIRNALFEVVLTNRGGTARSWKLREYRASNGEPVELLPQWVDVPSRFLAIDLGDPELARALNDALYQVERIDIPGRDGSGPGERVRFSWSDGRGLEVTKTFTFRDSWIVNVDLAVYDRGRRKAVSLVLGPGFAAQEPSGSRSTYYYESQGAWNLGGRVTRLRPKKLVAQEGAVEGPIVWAGLEDQYFAALIVPDAATQARARWRPTEVTPIPEVGAEGDDASPEPVVQPLFSVSVGEEGGQLFIGPKDFRELRAIGYQLERVVWFATNPFLAWVSRWIFLGLLWMHDNVAPNYGLAIILTTMVLRIVLFPVNQYSMVHMKKAQLQMQRLQPKINAIKAKYKKDKTPQTRAKVNEETMKLYKEEGVNPAGGLTGCLPLLAQFPILIGFYNMLTVAIELRGAPFFGWIQDLSHRDPYWILPLLMGVTMFAQQKLAMSKTKNKAAEAAQGKGKGKGAQAARARQPAKREMDPMAQQQKIMMFMPVFFTYICLQMPAGMVLYWFVNNLLGIGQQWLVNRHTSRLEAAAQRA